MSYYVAFEVSWGAEGFDNTIKSAAKEVLSCMEDYVRADGRYKTDEWLRDFRDAFYGKVGHIKNLDKDWATGLLTHMSACFPKVLFAARGVGEEIDDVWVLWFQGGRKLKRRPAAK